MEKKFYQKSGPYLVIGVIVIIVVVIVLIIWAIKSQTWPAPSPSPETSPSGQGPQTTPSNSSEAYTLSQGNQMHYGDIFIALGNVNNNSAWLYVHKDGENDVKQSVAAGDQVQSFGYTIEVKSVEKIANPSTLPGSSHGDIKFIISKQ